MKPSYLAVLAAALCALLTVSGCDDSSSSGSQSAPGSAAQSQKNTPLDSAQRERLEKASAGKSLTIQDASEIQLDGASTLSLTFSVPLDPAQDFARVVHLVDKQKGQVDGAWELSADLKELRLRHLEPRRELIVTVDSGLKALNKNTFGQSWEKSITTRDIEPVVGFASRGSLLPGKVVAGLPVMALNIDRVDVNFYRIKPESLAAFVSQWEYRNALSNWESDTLLKMADLVYSGRFDLNPAPNTREKLLLPLNDIAPLQQPGVYVAVMNQAGHYNYSNPATLFTLSDIGLSLHRYHNQVDIFTQSLENGAGKGDVTLQLLNQKGQVLASATTDGKGHASLENHPDAALVLAREKGQTTMLDLSQPALDLAEFDIAGDPGYNKQFFMFGPRDLYRPGETVIVNGLLRDADGHSLPDQPVKLEVVRPDGQVARTVVVQPQNGLYSFTYPLDSRAGTGQWHIRANTGDNLARNWDFHVEDFMPERMALRITAQKAPVAPDEDVTFRVSGRYLYGAPASGNALQGKLFLRPLREAVEKLPGFQFGDAAEANLTRTLDEVQSNLDEQGKAEITVPSQWTDTASPLNVILQASLLESGGRPVTRQTQQAIWPADVLPGIRPQFAQKSLYDYRTGESTSQAVVDENSQAGFDIVYAQPDGKQQTVKGLAVRLIRERRDYYWNWSEDEGWTSRFDQKDLVEGEQTLDLAAGETGKVSFPVSWGSYRLEVKDPEGHLSSVRFWAGYSWQDNSEGTGAIRPDRVTLKMDKPAYKPGDTIKLHIAAPQAGKGYAMVESGEGPVWWQEIDVPADGLDISIPVDKSWQRHDLYLSALVVRPGDKARALTPKRAVGLLHLPLGDESRRLNVALETPPKMRPNQPLTVKVKATAQDGALPAQVSVLISAVDSGVLNITDYATPDPWQAFLGRKRYGADIYDIYGNVIEGQGRMATLKFGGDGDALKRGGKPPVNHVTIIAQQALPVVLNAQGEGTVTLPVGDFNGELRVMAQVWSADRFGSSDSKVVVAAPLVAELSSPRFMAGGDQARLALDLTNLTDKPQTLSVNWQASGLLKLAGDATSSVVLSANERRTVFIPVQAQTGLGDGVLDATISGVSLPGETFQPLHKQWKIGVRPAFPARTVSGGTMLQPGESWQVPASLLSGLAPQTLEGQLLLSGRPPLNLARYIRELYAWPYGCLEQTTSGIFPSLYTNHEQLRALGIKSSSDAKRREAIDTGIAHILEMQRDNGGFGLWDKESPEEYWLTAYATDFLLRASEQGYSVPADALDKASARLLRYLQDPGTIAVRYSDNPAASRFAVQSYAALVLSRQQKAPLGALRILRDQSAAATSGLPLVQLGIALTRMGDSVRGQQAILKGVNFQGKTEHNWLGDYGSPLRDNALILSLLEENNLLADQRAALLNRLSEQAWGEQWLSTQENNALFLAARQQDTGTDKWRADASFSSTPLQGEHSQVITLSSVEQAALNVTNRGEAPLWVRLDSTGYPEQAPAPASNVLHIERHYLDAKGETRSLNGLKSGELVLVWLDIWSDKQVPDALVEDLLPAGLELENQNLANSAASLTENGSEIQNLINQMQQEDIQHIEFRDDRFVAALSVNEGQHATLVYLARAVTPGVYQIPAPLVTSMYVPQWRATGNTESLLHVVP